MLLSDYVWSRNPRGMHVKGALVTPLDHSRWMRMRAGWVKLVAAEHEYVDDAMNFLAQGITPIVRLYVPRFGASPFTVQMRELTLAYARAGVKWFEFYNEPNQPIEWPEGVNVDWRNYDGIIRPLMDNWLVWAEYIASLGCYPGFIALAESDYLPQAAVRWMDAFLNDLARRYYDRFRNLLAGGMYVATHPYILNHYYQEVRGGGPLSARPPEAQNAEEPGWHFEYPYDPICQASDPGRTVYGGTPLTPNGDPVGLTAMGRMFNERAAALFGSQAVPVVGTEGGIWPFPRDSNNPYYQQDNRYPRYTHESQAEGTVAMFEWVARQAPPWFFGVCLWKEDEYFEPGAARAATRLEQIAPLVRNVPTISVMADGSGPIALGTTGPGPIHGEPDFHMVILAPGTEPGWFFDTAQAYWNTFRPIVTTLPDFIGFVPNTQSVAATVITPPDQADAMTRAIHDHFPNVLIDLIVTEDLDAVRDLFNSRVWANRRLG
jgi:hypothetical protein